MNSNNLNQGPYCINEVDMEFIIENYQPEEVLGLGEAADALKISKEHLNALINEGKIPCLKITDRDNRLVILKKDLGKAIYKKPPVDNQPDHIDDIRKMMKSKPKNIENILSWEEYQNNKNLYSIISIKNKYGYKDSEMYKIYDAAQRGFFGEPVKFRGGARNQVYRAYDKNIVDKYLKSQKLEFQHKPDSMKSAEELKKTQRRSVAYRGVVGGAKNKNQKFMVHTVKQSSKSITSKPGIDNKLSVNAIISKVNIGENVGFAKQMKINSKYYVVTVHFNPINLNDQNIPTLRLGIYEGMQENDLLQKLLKAIGSDVVFTTNVEFIKEKLINQKVLAIYKYVIGGRGKKIYKFLDFMPAGSKFTTLKLDTAKKQKSDDIVQNKLKGLGVNIIKENEIKDLKNQIQILKNENTNYRQIIENLNEDLTSALSAIHYIDEMMILFEHEYKLTEKYVESIRDHISVKDKIRKFMFKTRIKQNIQKSEDNK